MGGELGEDGSLGWRQIVACEQCVKCGRAGKRKGIVYWTGSESSKGKGARWCVTRAKVSRSGTSMEFGRAEKGMAVVQRDGQGVACGKRCETTASQV